MYVFYYLGKNHSERHKYPIQFHKRIENSYFVANLTFIFLERVRLESTWYVGH
jgi:hypothetical protein